jgi:hypothetical protein
MPTYAPNPFANARRQGWHRQVYEDPATYLTSLEVRIDAAFSLMGIFNELGLIIDTESIGKRVRVKNTLGANWTPGTLLRPATLKLTPQTTGTSTSSPTRGTAKVLLIAATFEVGQVVEVVSAGLIDRAIVTAVSAGVSVTVDVLFNDHTLPTVTALPAYEAQLADADGSNHAEWVTADTILIGAYGWAYDTIEVGSLDTSLFVSEDEVYLSGTAGGWTKTAPSGGDQTQQAVGEVKTVDAALGKVLFFPGNKRFLKFGSSMMQPGMYASADNILANRIFN